MLEATRGSAGAAGLHLTPAESDFRLPSYRVCRAPRESAFRHINGGGHHDQANPAARCRRSNACQPVHCRPGLGSQSQRCAADQAGPAGQPDRRLRVRRQAVRRPGRQGLERHRAPASVLGARRRRHVRALRRGRAPQHPHHQPEDGRHDASLRLHLLQREPALPAPAARTPTRFSPTAAAPRSDRSRTSATRARITPRRTRSPRWSAESSPASPAAC